MPDSVVGSQVTTRRCTERRRRYQEFHSIDQNFPDWSRQRFFILELKANALKHGSLIPRSSIVLNDSVDAFANWCSEHFAIGNVASPVAGDYWMSLIENVRSVPGPLIWDLIGCEHQFLEWLLRSPHCFVVGSANVEEKVFKSRCAHLGCLSHRMCWITQHNPLGFGTRISI